MKHLVCIMGVGMLLLGVSVPRLGWAQATLETPQPNSFQSGIGLIRGWVCNASRIDLEADGHITVQAVYHEARLDVAQQGKCDHSDVGFSYQINWANLGDGSHTVRVLADGVEIASAAFSVATLRTDFLRGASGSYRLSNFPEQGLSVLIQWQEDQQNFVITGECPPLQGCCSGHGGVQTCTEGAVICQDGTASPTCHFYMADTPRFEGRDGI